MTYVIDTNIISEVLNSNDNRIKERIEKEILKGEDVFLNAISYYETKRGLLASNASKKLKKFEDFFLKNFELLMIDSQDILDIAAKIYAKLKLSGNLNKKGDADILIAAITLNKGYTLISNDIDFEKIKSLGFGLLTENWSK